MFHKRALSNTNAIIAVAAGFAIVIVGLALIFALAAGPVASREAEDATGANIINDTTASNSKALLFGAAPGGGGDGGGGGGGGGGTDGAGKITVSGDRIMRDGQPWWFVGYNSFIWSQDCGTDDELAAAGPSMVEQWFSTMRKDGHAAVRVFFYDGWNFDNLDHLVATAKANNAYVTITLDDAIGGCSENDKDAGWFANQSERDTFKNHMTAVLERYKGNNTVAWLEYFNEPDSEGNALREFYDEMGAHADTIDPERLFSSGTVAPYWVGGEDAFRNIHESPGVDIASLHEYDGNEIESNHGPKVRANSAGKPYIAGEVGFQSNKPWEGCDGDVGGMVQRVTDKAQTYVNEGYAATFFWAWQPPNSNCGNGLENLTGVHDALRNVQ